MKKISIVAISVITLCISCVKDPQFSKKQKGDHYYRDFSWEYKGHSFNTELSYPISTYNYYNSLPKSKCFESCAIENPSYPYLDYTAGVLKQKAAKYHFDDREMAEYVLAFVQSIPGALDPTGYGYNRDGILTIIDGQGDCVDHTALYDGIMSHLGYITSMLVFYSDRHMIAGVEIPRCAYTGYKGASGIKYVCAEATWPGVVLGVSSYPKSTPEVIEINPVYTESLNAEIPLSFGEKFRRWGVGYAEQEERERKEWDQYEKDFWKNIFQMWQFPKP